MKISISGAHGNKFCIEHEESLLRYADSLKNLTDCHHFLFTDEMPADIERKLAERSVMILRREPAPNRGEHYYPWNPAFIKSCQVACLDFLKQLPRGSTIIATSAGNSVFQTDIPELKGLHVASEGMPYHESAYNWEDMRGFRPEFLFESCQNKPVINGGQQFGDRESLIDFYEKLLATEITTTNQAATNWLIHSGQVAATIHDPRTSALCLTGEGVATGHVQSEQVDGLWLTPRGARYAFVHQIDRMDF
jgi:hypothetical protein